MELSKQATEFFLYSYFGITPNEIEEDCLELFVKKCAKRSYLDLNRTLLYDDDSIETISGTEQEIVNGYRHSLFATKISNSVAEDIIKKMINDRPETQKDFNYKHSEICESIISIAQEYEENGCRLIGKENPSKSFYFGQAQKWLNMTLKYLWLLGKCNGLEEFLHVPVDSFIMEAASSELSIKIPSKNKQNYGEYSSNSLPWSKWCDESYSEFQKNIRESIKEREDVNNPIEWEGNAWIDVAHERKEKEDESNKKTAEKYLGQ